ncbi:MAG: hypothetical protein IKD31_04915 [Clostridia bacterium]|nr:hypothetical protein [Clostridia bacterium]
MKKKKLSKFKEEWTEEKDSLEPESEKEEMEESRKEQSAEEMMEEDISLFRRLFPDVSSDKIPEEVWKRVEAGESLAAAYALYSVQKMREEEAIEKVNAENEKKAPPRIRHDGADKVYFSPEAVKAMSRSEIKKNYDEILASMDNWN